MPAAAAASSRQASAHSASDIHTPMARSRCPTLARCSCYTSSTRYYMHTSSLPNYSTVKVVLHIPASALYKTTHMSATPIRNKSTRLAGVPWAGPAHSPQRQQVCFNVVVVSELLQQHWVAWVQQHSRQSIKRC